MHRISWKFNRVLLLLAFLTHIAAGGDLSTVFIPEPAADRWMYPANGTPGARPQASTFSALPDGGGVDDRFGQFVIMFDTLAAGIPAGLGSGNYDISSISFTATIAQNELFLYDPTEDHWITYGEMALPDEDPGRPLALHGTGFRNGFTTASFQENSPYAGGDPSERSAFALGFDESSAQRDVSSNVTGNFDPHPWAIGKINGLSPGDPVPVDTVVTFQVDLSSPGVADYIRSGLNEGRVWFTLSSLHPAIQQGGEFVSYYTKESPIHQLFADAAPTLEVTYSLPSGFTRFERDPSKNVTLEFIGLPGFSYVLQSSPDLREETWDNIETFTPLSPSILNWQAFSPSEKRFFRIARTPITP